MKRTRSIAIAFIIACFTHSVLSQSIIHKVEPPNWWTNHSWNPIRLLIHGKNLQGARVVSHHNGVQIGLVSINQSGTYAFVDLHIDKNAGLGNVSLELSTHDEQEQIPFSLQKPLTREGRFQGISSDDVIYLLMPDRFANGDASNDNPSQSAGLCNRLKTRYYHGGDFQGIIDKLPYLKDLGVTALWLNPIYDNHNALNEKEIYDEGPITDYHGYGAVDFYGVEEHFGDFDLFRKLVDQAHAHGIKVVMDQVANHTSPYHRWVKDPPTPTWYNGSEGQHLKNVWQTWTLNDPYASDAAQKDTLEGWFIDILPDLNQNDKETALYLIQNSLWWIGVSGIDAIRQDTLPYVPRSYWRDWAKAVKKEYPHFILLGEMFDGDPAKVSFYQGGRSRFDGIDSGIDALFDFPLFYKIRDAFAKQKSLREAVIALSKDWLYENPELLVTFLGLHDVARFMNEENATVEGLKLAYTFLMTTRGVPLIYYGDEIAMPGGGDPDNRRDFPGGWPDDERNAFYESGRTEQEQSVLKHVQTLASLRRTMAPLRGGRLVHLVINDQEYVYARILDKHAAIIAINNFNEWKNLLVPVHTLGLDDGLILRDCLKIHSDVRIDKQFISIKLPPRSGIFLCNNN
ncbi:MAG: alpha-amylase family glycosyl hydrolase [Candidatus Omnitrophota bacterium]